jgi:hypothetical protein
VGALGAQERDDVFIETEPTPSLRLVLCPQCPLRPLRPLSYVRNRW